MAVEPGTFASNCREEFSGSWVVYNPHLQATIDLQSDRHTEKSQGQSVVLKVSQPRLWFSLNRVVTRSKERWQESSSSLLPSWQRKPEA